MISLGGKGNRAGFPFYLGEMSQLVRALINFFLEEASVNGYEEVHSPIVVNAASATATGQLPDKEGRDVSRPKRGGIFDPNR